MKSLNYYLSGIIHKKKLDSTSSFLKQNYSALKNNTIVWADYQSDGHGRMGRSWESNPKENLMLSILIKDKELISRFDSLSLASAVAAYKALKSIGITSKIKWPNDVYVGDKKICGILLEAVSNNNNMDCVIVGIGLNVNQKEFVFNNATSIVNEGISVNANTFFKIFVKYLRNEFTAIRNNASNYLEIIRENNYLEGKEAYAIIDNQKCLVSILGINNDNSLKVIFNGHEYNITTDEITFHI